MRFQPLGRAWRLAVLLAALAIWLTAIVIDASVQRQRRAALAPRHDAVVALTGLPDLMLSTSSRWLRHPSQAEPGAAVSDLPSSLDVDPAGMLIGPPLELHRAGPQ